MAQAAGRLNLRIQVYKATQATDPTTRQPKTTFDLLCSLWASREAGNQSEIDRTAAVREVGMDRWLIRRRSDINEKDEVRYGGNRYRIQGIEYAGRDMIALVTKLYV